MTDLTTDVLIIGGGPAGATAALRLLQRGVTPLILEREQFPRYHIGEAMTGEAGAIVRELGFGDQMGADGHIVKHGVRVFGSRGNGDWWVPVMQRTEDKELHEVTTYQVRRSTFDKMMLDEAVHRGAGLLCGRATDPIMSDDGSTLTGVQVATDDGRTVGVSAQITLDCSGQATFLANRKVTGPKYLGSYDKQIAIFSQVDNYIRDDGSSRQLNPGNTHIFYKEKYHWAWAIGIDADVTSIGVVVPAQYFRDARESKDDFIRREVEELHSGLATRLPDPNLVEDAHVIPNYSFQVRKFAGPGYICVGDSHRFVDPIFSFGLYVAMQEAGLAADEVLGWLDGKGRGSDSPFESYMLHTERAIDILEDMIDTFWENPLAFAVFAHDRYRDQLLDMFAGRIYDGMPVVDRDRALTAFRKLLNRDRVYDPEGMYSVPIGSRFHPERAPLWNSELDTVETTERWIREQG
jgi:flavin-dependent dehydrogenase